MGKHEELFKFATKAGALEGYLYEREKVEPLYNWVTNIEKMYANLPENVKEDIRNEFGQVLTRILTYGEKVLQEEMRIILNNLLSASVKRVKSSTFHSIPIIVRGRVSEGLRESSFFTHLAWVRAQFIAKLGIDPYLGTLNLDIIDAEDMEKLKEIKKRKGIEIIPAEPGFCSARCFRVLVSGKVRGAIVIPQVPDYPESKLEIISSDRIRDVLSLKVGDLVSVEIL